MVTNLNDVIRDKMSKDNFFEIVIYFDSLEKEQQINVLRLMLLDYYKLNCNNISMTQLDLDDFIYSCFDDMSLIYNLILHTKAFNEMDYISKCILMETMEDLDMDDDLFKISNLHLLDKLTYKIVDDIECYKDYYKDYITKNENSLYRRNNITNVLALRILDLKKFDSVKYKKYILEFIKTYYKWKLFIKNHDGEYLLNDIDFVYLNKIENTDIDILLGELYKDIAFLSMILGEFLHYKTSVTEIKEEVVDSYLKEAVNENVKQKLHIV